jgi:hypothetical protein
MKPIRASQKLQFVSQTLLANQQEVASGDTFPDGAKVRTDLPTSTVMVLMLEDYCAHLRTIREMIDIYSSEKLLLDHRNLWQIFKKNKF